MKYAVELTPTAESQLKAAFAYIHERAPLNAQRWLVAIHQAIDSLETLPHRCSAAREAEHLGEPLKHYLFKSHRIIFWIDEEKKAVRILNIRHSAQQAIGEPVDDSED